MTMTGILTDIVTFVAPTMTFSSSPRVYFIQEHHALLANTLKKVWPGIII
jgi:hypothetical protein